MKKELLVNAWQQAGLITDEKVIKAFMSVKRENFILSEHNHEVYYDYPLPIPAGQTISQPTTIVIMTQALELKKGMNVLEVGAGSGYQAALIAELIGNHGNVHSTEIIEELVEFAKANLKKEKVTNVTVVHHDGSTGYSKHAPYDRIIVTAACPKVPEPLLQQLKDNGILVAPVGAGTQKLLKIKKRKTKYVIEDLGDFAFVPLTGKLGFEKG